MGFFSSRNHEPAPLPLAEQNSSFTKVIRSRFYGRSKHKDKPETDPSPVIQPAPPPQPARPQTDHVTMTLAQRLNELSTANTDGLLDDEEYRLLRQSLFERFTSHSEVVTEGPSGRIHPHPKPTSVPRAESAHSSSSRPPSIRSSSSVKTAMSSLLRRVGTHRNASQESLARTSFSSPQQETASIRSLSSSTPQTPFVSINRPKLGRKHSAASLQSEDGGGASPYKSFDTVSISSRRTGKSTAYSDYATRSTRSTRSRGPPSSFHLRTRPEVVGEDPNEEMNLMKMTATDIRNEIIKVEAEGRRLLDAFNGLELSTLTKRRQHSSNRTPSVVSNGSRLQLPSRLERSPSTYTLVPDRQRKDSNTSAIAPSVSMPLSTLSNNQPESPPKAPSTKSTKTRHLGLPISFPIRRASKVQPPDSAQRIRRPSESSDLMRLANGLSRSSPHLPLPPNGGVSENHFVRPTSPLSDEAEEELAALNAEMDDIRRRRAEVSNRYDQKVEYLRAMLKGAEIRDKLAKKK